MKNNYYSCEADDFSTLVRRIDRNSIGTINLQDLFNYVFPFSINDKPRKTTKNLTASKLQTSRRQSKIEMNSEYAQTIRIPSPKTIEQKYEPLVLNSRTDRIVEARSNSMKEKTNSNIKSLNNYLIRSLDTDRNAQTQIKLHSKALERIIDMHQNYYTQRQKEPYENEYEYPYHPRFYSNGQYYLYSPIKADSEANTAFIKRYDTPFHPPLSYANSSQYYRKYYSDLFKTNLSKHFL